MKVKKDAIWHLSGGFMNFSTLFSTERLSGRRHFQKGDMLLYPDSDEYAILFLESGTVEVSRFDMEGERILQSFMTAPQCFGLVEAFADTPLLCGVKALTKGSCYALSPEDPLFKDREVLEFLLRYISTLYVEEMGRSAREKNLSGKERVLYTLYRMAQGPLPYTLPLTREDLSDLLAIPSRSLYRYLKELEEEGFFKRTGGKIIIDKDHFSKIGEVFRSL